MKINLALYSVLVVKLIIPTKSVIENIARRQNLEL